MKTVTVNDIEYEIITDYREGFQKEDFINKFTEYFNEYDYIVGDWAYSKLRLKGFFDDKNPKSNKINKYSNLQKYLDENCAYGCRYFVLKKIKK